MFELGVKFCGNCNPVINSKEILAKLSMLMPECKFTAPGADVAALLILSGCEADCATRPDFDVKTIVVAGLSVDLFPCPEEQIPNLVAKKLIAIKDKMVN
ncbi:hypothetical protein SAMN05660649_01262 [Desulfotomaculum arcticum]|uniref:Uncharacterized protein n=1 Tax=Desulfotruncus arcticus DSM 17038 TaxID=1121424 RepID=A0A1I2QLT9_9FIRM|nr:hypothetical protein [Desulfotruncus arcticus]SFG28279.1 hypothetical protein SAMN05660649_01262 [Desulfotomaculum arcticum] [Desulfotruncus arcticus DSM 17038]